MSADQRVTAAREFLAGARKGTGAGRAQLAAQKASGIPHSGELEAAIREAAELRRLLGQLLTLVDDFEVEEQLHDVTGLTPSGGARLSPAAVLVLDEALSDAIAYRAPDTCRDCARGAQCDDHAEDVRRRSQYWDLAAALGIDPAAGDPSDMPVIAPECARGDCGACRDDVSGGHPCEHECHGDDL